MADHDRQVQVFGEQGEPCQGCGSPLAADQRYCLNCGKRRGGPRVDYGQVMGGANADSAGNVREEPASTSAPTTAGEKPERDYAPLAAVGGIAVLGLMLLVGVLIGKGNTSTSSAPAPIVKVGATEGSAGTESAASDKSETTAAKPKQASGSKKVNTGAKAVDGGLTGAAARNSDATVQATTDDLEALEGKSGESYEETVKKLPDKIATPGAPPPIDKTKAAGGGGSAETIE